MTLQHVDAGTVAQVTARRWGKLDILVHSIAFAPLEDLRGSPRR
jgi:enoyl-[acyl-carrier-protein] reductase (NADH)